MVSPHGRRIFFSKNCEEAAEKIGGYEQIDDSLVPILDALEHNPYGFPLIQSDWFSFRLAITKPFRDIPPLVWQFFIEPNGDVVLDHVEEFDGY